MKTRKQTPLVLLDKDNEKELRSVRLVKQVPFYPFRNPDEITIRNMGIRMAMDTMHRLTDLYEIKIPYGIKIKMTQDWFNTSPQNIERIITDNTDK
jgi:hypothetical protein